VLAGSGSVRWTEPTFAAQTEQAQPEQSQAKQAQPEKDAAPEASVTKVDVFPPGLNNVARYRIPGIVVTPRGTILAYCEARRNDSRDWGEIEVHLRRSTDGGKTWQPSQQIAHRAPRIEGNPTKAAAGAREQTVNNPVAIVDRQTGNIEFLYCVNYARCFSQRSTDEGVTWSEPVEITDSFLPFRDQYPWKVIATGPGHGVQLKSGRLVVPIWLAYGKNGDHAPSASGTIYSDDHGRTWRAGEIAIPNSAPYVDPNETMITVLSDGRVMLVNRNVSPENRKLVTFSRDGATGWSRPEFHEQLWEPICMASILAHPDRPGTLIFSNPHTLPTSRGSAKSPVGPAAQPAEKTANKPAQQATAKPMRGASGKRENLTIKLSTDDGRTWKVSKTLEAGPSAYSDLAALPGGELLCLYERGNSITCARFSLDWINTLP
jgi:sialidase-1